MKALERGILKIRLADLRKATVRKDRLLKMRDERLRNAQQKIEAETSPSIKQVAAEIETIILQLAALNPYQVGNHFQRVSDRDGLPTGPVYQVTRIHDHEFLWARPVLARGRLGASIERFNITRDNIKRFVKLAPVATKKKIGA
jgi:hypothetical protein